MGSILDETSIPTLGGIWRQEAILRDCVLSVIGKQVVFMDRDTVADQTQTVFSWPIAGKVTAKVTGRRQGWSGR